MSVEAPGAAGTPDRAALDAQLTPIAAARRAAERAMPGRRIRIIAGSVSADAALDDSATADAVSAALPLSVAGQTWGDGSISASP